MINYKIDVFKELEKHGFTQARLKKENLLSQQTISNIRAGKSTTASRHYRNEGHRSGKSDLLLNEEGNMVTLEEAGYCFKIENDILLV